jgi:hypothetical protein
MDSASLKGLSADSPGPYVPWAGWTMAYWGFLRNDEEALGIVLTIGCRKGNLQGRPAAGFGCAEAMRCLGDIGKAGASAVIHACPDATADLYAYFGATSFHLDGSHSELHNLACL